LTLAGITEKGGAKPPEKPATTHQGSVNNRRRHKVAASVLGRRPIFKEADKLWEACVEYFCWVEDNPLIETKAFQLKHEVRIVYLPKMRAMTVGGLCLFLNISGEIWRGWKTEGHPRYRADLVGVIRQVEQVIFEHKYAGVATGLLAASIISRELGLMQRANQRASAHG
jgi:hypothetical protein